MKEVDADLLTASEEFLPLGAGPPKISHPSLPLAPAGRQERRAAAPGRAGPGSRRVSDSLAPSAGASRDTERAPGAAVPRHRSPGTAAAPAALPVLAPPGSRRSQNHGVLQAGKDR